MMNIIERIEAFAIKNRLTLFLFYFMVNLPLSISTFGVGNWSDDFQYTNLLAIKAQFSPLLPLFFEPVGGDPQGGHFGPVYMLVNYLFTLITLDPRFFHACVLLCFVLTAFVLHHIVKLLAKDERVALLSGSLFLLNYYIAFKALHWNCFHSHATNTLTGAVSLYFMVRYIREERVRHLLFSCLFLAVTILNLESGFLFFPVLVIILFFSMIQKKIPLHKVFLALFAMCIALSTYPIGSYVSMGQWNPLGHRMDKERTVQNYAFFGNELLVKSLGISIFYNKLIFNPLKNDERIKEPMIRFLRENDKSALSDIPAGTIVYFLAVGVMTAALLLFLLVSVITRVRAELRPFIWIYACAFLIYLVIFYRVDIANAVSLFSSVILADLIMSFRADANRNIKKIGAAFLALILAGALWAVVDRFDDCYQKSFFGIQKITVNGPYEIYKDINEEIGHFAHGGILMFTHDHSAFHRTGGFERIGDMLEMVDAMSYNATVYSKEMKKRIGSRFKDKKLADLVSYLGKLPGNQRVFVKQKQDAYKYITDNQIDLEQIDAVYVSDQYEVEKLVKQ